ncbi:hypothetical protein [Synechococcus elongatus]|uniref:hypothetical protein n=1 Tax=Synechococcus elongatus TaxID=32046 RepID=UPI000F7E192D|nr:hypothetical protein [Synechococcus elongatus]
MIQLEEHKGKDVQIIEALKKSPEISRLYSELISNILAKALVNYHESVEKLRREAMHEVFALLDGEVEGLDVKESRVEISFNPHINQMIVETVSLEQDDDEEEDEDSGEGESEDTGEGEDSDE